MLNCIDKDFQYKILNETHLIFICVLIQFKYLFTQSQQNGITMLSYNECFIEALFIGFIVPKQWMGKSSSFFIGVPKYGGGFYRSAVIRGKPFRIITFALNPPPPPSFRRWPNFSFHPDSGAVKKGNRILICRISNFLKNDMEQIDRIANLHRKYESLKHSQFVGEIMLFHSRKFWKFVNGSCTNVALLGCGKC